MELENGLISLCGRLVFHQKIEKLYFYKKIKDHKKIVGYFLFINVFFTLRPNTNMFFEKKIGLPPMKTLFTKLT